MLRQTSSGEQELPVNSTGDRSLYKPFVGIAVLAESRREAATLVRALRNTPLARVVFFSRLLPQTTLSANVIKEIQESPTRIALVAVGTKNPQPGINAISQLYASTAGISVVGYGSPVAPSTVVAAMYAGARDFITSGTGPRELTEAFQRLLGDDDSGTPPVSSSPDSPSPGGSFPPDAFVGVRKPTGPKTLPPQKVAVEVLSRSLSVGGPL
jgi:DNA-binding NarL/FixJ family response regulator